MPKSQSTNTIERRQSRLALALIAGGLVAGCGGDEPWTIDPEGYDGLGEETFSLLANPCVITTNNTTMTLSVRGGETLYLSLRAADATVIAAAQTASSGECSVPSTYKIVVAEDGANAGVEKVFLDYINGPFSIGSTTAGVVTPGITLALGAGSSLVVRGSSGADKIFLGSTFSANVLQFSWINVNGDTSPDVRMAGVTDVKVSTGVGADIISADGGNGTTGLSLDTTIAFSAFGGPDIDTLTGGKGTSTLDGGDADDKFVQTATVGADNIVGGKGLDTVDYSVRTAAVNVTVCTTCSNDPCGCIAADVVCDAAAETAKTTCDTAAGTAKTTCDTAAGTAKTTCDAAANTAKTTCDATANSDHTTCTAACTPGDTVCTDACDDALDAALDVCTQTQTTALALCDTTEDAALALCATTQTTALATCATTRTTALATCDATKTTCQQGCGTAACSVCLADDGAALEGDTVNDDAELVLGGKGNDTLSAFYGVCSDAAVTPVVKCTLKGNDGDDSVTGSAFNDLLEGGNGNDVMQGGAGNDTFVGGAGFDTASYADRTAVVRASLDPTRLWVVGQNGETGELDVIPADVEHLTGGTGNDFLRGNASANIIHGGGGADTIEGFTGNDALYGDAGNDLAYGGAGNDMLVGGAGTDTVVGGDGDDFIDSTDGPAANDTLIDCDGVNDFAGTAGTSAGTADALVKDGSDLGALRCEL
jgi:Ca2+-binding RTX toxin-like protein